MESVLMLWNGELEPILSSGKDHPELRQLLVLSERLHRRLAESLGDEAETLEKSGAVSEETAAEMAEGIARTSGADIGVSTTGIAGPGGGTEEKPVGLVYVGFYRNGVAKAFKLNYPGLRETVRTRAVDAVFYIIRDELEGIEHGGE